LKTAANELCVYLQTKKEFQTLASELFRLWKYLNKEEKDLQISKERNAISGIYNELIEKRKNSDTVELMVQINKIVNEYVSTEAAENSTARSFDISQIDFDLLRKEFAQTKKQFLLINDLQQLIEQRLSDMLLNNPERIKYHERYQKIIEEYNGEQNRSEIEKIFDELMHLSSELDSEQQRYIREGFSTDEELSVYDLLFKEDLTKNEIKAIKNLSVELLSKIKEKISELDHWRDKPTTQAVVSNLIRDSLFVSLPQSYDDQSINRYTCLIYEHVYNRYPAIAG
jgi:type I restriction enzyme R subunit